MSGKAPDILVTGATGWLGRRLCEILARGEAELGDLAPGGAGLRCLVPAADDARGLADLGAEIVRGDVRDSEACQAFAAGAEGAVLIHLAGIIHPRRVAEFDAVNHVGTLNVFEAARKAGLKRAVIMSSNSPIGVNPSPDHLFTEESPYNPYMGYGRSKRRMEEAVLAAADKSGTELAIVRAPWFYGPYQPPRQTQFFAMVKAGRFPICGPGTNRRSMSYVDNLAQGLLLAAREEKAAGEIFWIADARPYAMNEIIDTVRAVLSEDFSIPCAPKTVRVPGIVADLAEIADAGLQAVGLYQQQIHVLSEMNKTIACDISKARRVLGFAPRIELREGMRRSVDWLLKQGAVI